MPFQIGNQLGRGKKYWLGKKHTDITKEKISLAHKKLKKPWAGRYIRTEALRNKLAKLSFKGDDVGYHAFHYRVYKANGQPKRCDADNCTGISKNFEWANLTGKYNDIHDYKRMCHSCHAKYDKLNKNFK